MANIKISQLPAASSPVSSSDVMPVVQSGVTKKAAIDQLGFLAAGVDAVTRTIQNKLRDTINLKDYGVVANGVVDDTAAFIKAINAQQASGATLLGVEGGNMNLATWSRVTCSSPFYFDGQNMTVTCGSVTAVEFINCQNDFDIRNVDFQNWFRVLDCAKTTNRIKLGVFSNNKTLGRRKLNAGGGVISNFAYQVSIQCYFDFLLIENNKIDNAFYTAIFIGSQDAGYTDDVMYRRARIIGNQILNTNIVPGTGLGVQQAGSVYGCLFQGHYVEYINNFIDTMDGSSTALGGLFGNGCYALYCKAKFAYAGGNYIKNIGTNTGLLATAEQSAINLKQASAVIENNTIINVGKDAPAAPGFAIGCDEPDSIVIRNNYCENVGNGIVASVATGATNKVSIVVDSNRINLLNKAAPYPGVIGVSSYADNPQAIVSNNTIVAPSGFSATVHAGISIDSFVLPDGGNCLLTGNSIINLPAYAFRASFGVNNVPIVNVRYENNYIEGCTGGFADSLTTLNGPNSISHIRNTFKSTTTPIAVTAGIAGVTIQDNDGYVTNSSGVASVATGATVTHGLITTPEIVLVTPLTAGVTDVTVTNRTSTTFVINFGGGGTCDFAWEAYTASYNGRV